MRFSLAVEIFELTKLFPREERSSFDDRIRRSSPAQFAQILEKRRYPPAFQSKPSDCETEAEGTRVRLEFCLKSGHLKQEEFEKPDKGKHGYLTERDYVLGQR